MVTLASLLKWLVSLAEDDLFIPTNEIQPYLVGNGDYEAGFYKLAAFATKRSLTEKQWDLFNLQGFTCASRIAAENRLRNGVTTYRYRYFGDWLNLRLYPGSGAYHEPTSVCGTAWPRT